MIWLTAIGIIALGSALIWLALSLFEECRKALAADPESDLVWAAVRGAPWAVIALIGGAMLGGSGLLLLAFIAATDAAHVWNALLQTLGLR